MAVTLKRAVFFSFVAGMVVPCAIELGGRYLDRIGVHKPMWLTSVFIYISPTGLWLIGTSNDLRSWVAFAVSVVANGLLYASIALVVGYLTRFVRTPDEDDWWPSAPDSRR